MTCLQHGNCKLRARMQEIVEAYAEQEEAMAAVQRSMASLAERYDRTRKEAEVLAGLIFELRDDDGREIIVDSGGPRGVNKKKERGEK